MDDKPKSIWKKSWKNPRGLLLWLISLTLIFIVIYANGSVPFSLKNYLGLPAYALFFSVFVTLMLLLAVKFFRWVFCWRNFKRFLFGFACFATLVALFYAEENWRGKHRLVSAIGIWLLFWPCVMGLALAPWPRDRC